METSGDAKQVPNGMAAGFWGVSLVGHETVTEGIQAKY